MSELNNYPTLFFLDAFGVKGITFDRISSIANYVSQYKGEMFLLFHNRAVARSAGQYKEEYPNEQQEKTAKTYIDHLTQLLGDRSDLDWKQKWLECKNQEQEFEKWALEYFKLRLQQETRFKGVASFEIKETYNGTRPQYHIVVGSNHPQKAFGEFLNEFFWAENKSLFFEYDKNKTNRRFMEKAWQREVDERITKIEPVIVEILQRTNRDWMSLEETITTLILEISDLGYLNRSEYRKILLSLHSRNIIEAKDLGKQGKVTLKSSIKIP